MTGYGPISLVFGLIVGVAYLAIQMNIAANVNQMLESQFAGFDYSNETTDAVEAVTAARSYEVFDARGRPASTRSLGPLLAPERFSNDRQATLSTFIDPVSLLAEGEVLPEGEMLDLMVEARSIRLADAACARLITALAAECGVQGFRVEPVDPVENWMSEEDAARHAGFEGLYMLRTTMVFTPKTPVGDLPESNRVTFNKRTFDLDRWSLAAPAADAVGGRADEILAAAARACDEIRAVHGNCTVIDVEMDGDQRVAGDFDGSFELAWLTPLQGGAMPGEVPGALPTEGAPESAPGFETPGEPLAPGGGLAPDAPLERSTRPDPAPSGAPQQRGGAPAPSAAPDAGTGATPDTGEAPPQGAQPSTLKGGKAGKWVSP